MAIRATSDLYFGVVPGKKNLEVLLLSSVLTTSAQSSLGTLNEFSDQVTAIIQLTGDEAEETLGKF
jgi:hypothetical protein